MRPLFNNFVFVYTRVSLIPKLIKRPLIISMVYWMSDPAVVSDEEIGAIRMAVGNYSQLELEKTTVAPGADLIITPEKELEPLTGSPFSYSGLTITLPSLGYRINASQLISETPITDTTKAGNFWLQRNLSSLNGFRLF